MQSTTAGYFYQERKAKLNAVQFFLCGGMENWIRKASWLIPVIPLEVTALTARSNQSSGMVWGLLLLSPHFKSVPGTFEFRDKVGLKGLSFL